MTSYEYAYRLILAWHVAAEEFDRTLPGAWFKGEWVPTPGPAMSQSLAHASTLARGARRRAAAAGVTARDYQAAREAVEGYSYEEKAARLAALTLPA